MAAFKDNFLVAVIASFGVILGAAYMLWLYKRVIFGKLINEDLFAADFINYILLDRSLTLRIYRQFQLLNHFETHVQNRAQYILVTLDNV